MTIVAKILENAGFELDTHQTSLFPQVIHVQFPLPSSATLSGADTQQQGMGDLFVFPSGTVVAWNVPEDVVTRLVSTELLPAAESPHIDKIETEDLEFYEDIESEKSYIIGDRVKLGTKLELESTDDAVHRANKHYGNANENSVSLDAESRAETHHDTRVILSKIAFSSGLARSVKLAVLESLLDAYFESTRSIPTLLSQGSRLPFTRSFILRKTGELLSLRAQLNLYSELTDSLPDIFWDSRHELGLEGYYDQVGRALDVGVRIKVLNEKMDYAQEIASVLRERLSEKHGLSLEWSIIILISIEVGFEIMRLWKERAEREDPNSTESLFRRYLATQLNNDYED